MPEQPNQAIAPVDPKLAATAEQFRKMREKYQSDPKTNTFNALICGEMGTGKTHLLKTARLPVLVHMFDPGGENTLRDEIQAGKVVVEKFAPDNPHKPWAFDQWRRRFDELDRQNFFENFGTFALDSSTIWAETILNYFVAKRNPGGVPDGKLDYMPQKNEIRNWIDRILSLPCDVIVTGHLEATEDQVTGRVTYRYATTGKGSLMIPAKFDEVYVALADDSAKGVNYKLQTAGAGRYAARSRLAQGGKLDQFEAPDLKALLKKVGYSTEDKPLFL